MYIESVYIKNFRGIEELEIKFHPGVNILIGDNGSGKTTVLEALAVALGGYLQGIQNLKVGGILQDDFRWSMVKLAGASNQIQYHSPEIDFDLNIEGKSLHGHRSRSNREGSEKTSTRCSEIQKYAQEIANNPKSIMPLLSYMSISRVTMSRRADYGKSVKNQLNDRRCGYIGCMDSIVDKANILEWVKKMSYEKVLHNKEVPELTFFQNVVSELMADVSELQDKPQILYSAELENIAYVEDGNVQPVTILSSGYQSLLWMVMDFTFRFAVLNPELVDSKKAIGIVLIDDIDIHLHPKWQWNILNALVKTFPQIQFIVTAHSPIIIASCKNATLINVTGSQNIDYLDDAYAYSIDRILELRQNSSGTLKELKEKIGVFDRYLNKDQLEEALEVLNLLEDQYGYNNPKVIEARAEYELSNMIVEE